LISGWKRDGGGRYCVAFGNRRDEIVDAADLSRYIAKLRATA
jgi:hypothetical protein